MITGKTKKVFLVFCVALLLTAFPGFKASAKPYDYTSSIECLRNPPKPQYNGGLIRNAEFNDWRVYGGSRIDQKESDGNRFIVAHTRNQPHDSFSQKLYLENNKLYSFSAWIRVNEGDEVAVKAVFKTRTVLVHAGAIVAQSGCWSMLKGGLTVESSGPAHLYFESDNTSVEIWVDSISLQPFNQEQWRAHQDQSIEKVRKSRVRVEAVDAKGKPLANAKIRFEQKRMRFPFGAAMNKNILSNGGYQKWFTSRPFTVTSFEDEMKWYSTEASQGHEDYSVADAMVQFAGKYNLAVRGHNVFWDDPNYQQGWLKSLSPPDLYQACKRRLFSLVGRYKGKVIAWDVENENLHYSFFENKLGQNTSGMFYNWVLNAGGRSTPLFMNDYNTIEDSRDPTSTPARYVQKLNQIRSYPRNNKAKLGIGLESHFTNPPNIPYIRSSIDTLGATGYPVWITELDIQTGPNQAAYLETILREVISHPKVSGIVIWAAWKPGGCYRMCLTDNNFNNLPTGDVVDKILKEFGRSSFSSSADSNGFLYTSLFHGDYEIKISHPALNSSIAKTFAVSPEDETTLLLRVDEST